MVSRDLASKVFGAMGCIHSILKRISKIKWMTHKISQGQKYSIGFQPRVEYNLLVNDINSLNQGHPFFLKKKKSYFLGWYLNFAPGITGWGPLIGGMPGIRAAEHLCCYLPFLADWEFIVLLFYS